MKVVVVGSGAREHALAHVLGRTAEVEVTPGRAGIPGSVPTLPEELEADLFVIGPEIPLVDGLADRLRAQGKLVLGPGAKGARLEGSKIWMKQVLNGARVPTADWTWFDDPEVAERVFRHRKGPYVIKTDYLAGGKGVLVTEDMNEAIADAKAKLQKGDIVIEAGLIGRELSFTALCFGSTNWIALPSAQDYKRLQDGDKGANTGGMGAYSPVPGSPGLDVIGPFITATLVELCRRGIDYRGILYAGLILTPDGIKVLEYNVRFGDPEAQVTLPRIQSDLAQLLLAAAKGESPGEVQVSDEACVTVVLASYGYPISPRTGDVITGIDEASAMAGVTVFHAGTARSEQGDWETAGGRVLSVTATDKTVAQARQLAYKAVSCIHFKDMHYRSDIAVGVG